MRGSWAHNEANTKARAAAVESANMTSSSPVRSPMTISLVVVSYFIISISLVFSNKYLLSPTSGYTVPVTFFTTWFQCVLTCIIIKLLGELKRLFPTTPFISQFSVVSYGTTTGRSVLPLSVVFVLMIILNNLCLKYVEVSFYNVARSLTIVINVLFTYFLLGERTSRPTLISLLVVIVGFFLGSEGEVNFSLIGTVFGVMSSVFVSLNAIYTKKVMPLVGNDKWALAYYNNFNASLLFFPAIFLSGEHTVLIAYQRVLFSSYYWFLMFIAGALGFLIGIVTVMQIDYTSPLTHNISGTAKSCVQTILAIAIWRNPITLNGGLGIFLVIAGSALYAFIRHHENESERKAKEAQKSEHAEKKALLSQEREDDGDNVQVVVEPLEKDKISKRNSPASTAQVPAASVELQAIKK